MLRVQQELRAQHAALRESQAKARLSGERYRELFEFTPVGNLALSGDHRITEANRAAVTLLEDSRVLIMNNFFSRYLAPGSEEVFALLVARARETGRQQDAELTLRRARQKDFPAHVFVGPARDGRAEGKADFLVTLVDLTEREEAAVALWRANTELERRVEQRTTELNASHSQLAAEMAQRTRLEAEIVEVSEFEQRRVGQDLHDGVCQELCGTGLILESLAISLQADRPDVAAQVSRHAQRLAQLASETKNLARGLHPITLAAGGLPLALAELAERVSETLPCTTTISCAEGIDLPDMTALALYRIAQEATSNAVRHAQAQRLRVRLFCARNTLTLIVEDDGQGLPGGRLLVGGMGLHIMAYRARTIGAAFEIRPRRPRGTRVCCELRILPAGKDQPGVRGTKIDGEAEAKPGGRWSRCSARPPE